jgi:mannosyltransferase
VLTRYDPNMGLYYLLLNFWERIFGESEFAVRSLSALFGALSVSALYLLGARLYGPTVGLVAGLLLALDAFIVE